MTTPRKGPTRFAIRSGPPPASAIHRIAATETQPSTSKVGRYEEIGPAQVLGGSTSTQAVLVRDRWLGRRVVAKRFAPEPACPPSFANDFRDEARLQGRLEHPAIPPIYDLTLAERGSPSYSMRHLRGRTLASALERLRSGVESAPQEFPLHRMLAALSTVCQAVHYAHEQGILHGTLTPEAILLGAFGEVYVLGWETARGFTEPGEGSVNRRKDESQGSDGVPPEAPLPRGPSPCTAPEQVDPTIGPISPRTDVFALGCILHMIVSWPTLVEPSQSAKGQGPAFDAPSSGDISRMQPELEALWTAATRPNPAERLSTARALADAIERYLAGFRDTERRKELAQSHARTAVETARRSSTDGPSALALRALALQEAGHALALDPENVDASRVVWRLMTELPPTQPVEVLDERRKRRDDRRRADYQELTRQTLVFFAFVPFILFMGVANVGYLVAWLTMVTLLLASLVFRYRMAPAQGWNILGPFVVSQGAVLIQVTMAGPVSALPTVVSLISLGVCINHLGKDRPKVLTAVAISLATIFLTIFGDSLGLLPSFVDYPRPTEVVVHAGLLRFERAKVLAVLPGLYVSIVATSAWISLARNRQLLELQRRLRLQRWQWSQLVPSTMEQVGRSSVSMEAVSNLGNPPSSVP